jgi:galactose-6-phosphate isomerase
MALLDVEFLLSDPDFADDFNVLRSVRTIDTNGRTVDTPASYFTYGVIQPAKEVQLRQLPDLERIGSFISVITPFRLLALTGTTAPDEVFWDCKTYRVKIVRDWTNFGEGFVEAICELTSLTQAGPP